MDSRKSGRVILLVRVLLVILTAESAQARPPVWWPWDTWVPGSGYMPVTRSPRVVAGARG